MDRLAGGRARSPDVHQHVDEMLVRLEHLKVWLLSAAGLLMGGRCHLSGFPR